MENVYSGLTEEAIKRLQEAADALGIEIPEIKMPANITKSKTASKTEPKNNAANLSSNKRGEAKKTSPKNVNMKNDFDGLDLETQGLLEFDSIAAYEQEKKAEAISAEEERKNALVEEISRNVAKRIEEEERQIAEAKAKGKTYVDPYYESYNKSKGSKNVVSARGRVNEVYDEYDLPERFTEPKKRLLLTRLIHRKAYNEGFYDDIEDDINGRYITQEDVDNSRDSTRFIDRHLYRRVRNYEDARDDVSLEKGWMAFKIGLVTVLLVGAMGLGHATANEMKEWQHIRDEANRVVTIDNARDHERLEAQSIIMQIADQTDYEFKNLNGEQQLDAALRIPAIIKKYPEARFRGAVMKMQDQELLEKIMEDSYGAELSEFTPEQLIDLKKLTYELIDDENKKMYVRDPEVVREKQLENERKNAETERGIGD